MKQLLTFFFLLAVTPHSQAMGKGIAHLQLKSKSFAKVGPTQLLNGFGCSGSNVSPDLEWSKGPEGTKAYAITLYDRDVRTGSGWWHWVVFNIPASTTKFKADISKDTEKNPIPNGAIQSRTDFGKPGYGGPCPPAGDKPHRYELKVFALKDFIPVDAEASGAMVGFYIQNLKIGEGIITTKFGR